MSADGVTVRAFIEEFSEPTVLRPDALAALARLEAERETFRQEALAANKAQYKAKAQRDALAEALRTIQRKHVEAWQDVDDLDDTGAHVGVARYHREQAGGLGIAADIARDALAEAGL